MRIIVERGSYDGKLKTLEFECQHFYPKDNVRIKNGPEQDVLVCQVQKQVKIIGYFGSTQQRNKAINALKKRSGDVVILGFNEYFCYEAFEDCYVIELLRRDFRNFSLQKHITLQYERKLGNKVLDLDAFKELGPLFIEAMKENRAYLIEDADKYSRLWAKCLWVPNLIIMRGISPRQFYKYLINKNNEKLNSTNS